MGVRILFLSVVVLILFLRNSSSQSCHDDNGLEQQMSKEGYSGCPWVNHMYVRGFKKKSSPNDLRGFKAAKCCVPPSVYLWKPNVCTSADWDLSFRKEGWATCPSGHFLLGFHRGGSNQLRSIQWATCCKPSVHPHRYKECYDQNVGSGDTWECNKHYHYVVGIHRGASESLSSINRLRCCSMYDQVLPLKGLDDVKTRIMDVTLRKLALLAHYLGYGWAAGCRGRVVGEDFIRDGDRWKAVYRSGCSGYKSSQRLKIAYENFSFRVKKMDYMKPEIKSIKPIVQDAGEIKNQDSLPTTTNVRRQIKSVRTVTHSSTERFKTTIGASLTLSYKSPGLIGDVATGTFKGSFTVSGGKESAQLNTDTNGEIKWDIVTVSETQTTNGNAGTSYQITTSQKQIDVPYKATIQVQFTARLEGFLRWGGGPNGKSTNYHQRWRGSGDRPTFNYNIGTTDKPFYKFLKQASDRGDSPWLWHLLKQKIPNSQNVLNSLTDESLYEFELHGKFRDVAGLDFNVQWDDVALTNYTLSF